VDGVPIGSQLANRGRYHGRYRPLQPSLQTMLRLLYVSYLLDALSYYTYQAAASQGGDGHRLWGALLAS